MSSISQLAFFLMYFIFTTTSQAAFTINNDDEVAMVKVNIPSVINQTAHYDFQFMIPLPEGKFDEYQSGFL